MSHAFNLVVLSQRFKIWDPIHLFFQRYSPVYTETLSVQVPFVGTGVRFLGETLVSYACIFVFPSLYLLSVLESTSP